MPSPVTISPTGLVTVNTDAGTIDTSTLTVWADNAAGNDSTTFDVTVASVIEFVASGRGTVPIGASVTSFTLPGSPVADDVVFVAGAADSAFGNDRVASPGWDYIDYSSSASPGWFLARKVMTSTPDTSVDIQQHASRVGAVILWTMRGVDTVDPTPTNTKAAGGAGQPDPPSITTAYNNSWVLALGCLDDVDNEDGITAPPGYSNLITKDTEAGFPNGATVMAAFKLVETAGVENPGAFGMVESDGWEAASVEIKKA